MDVEVEIEVPRGARLRRDARGRLLFASPVPCPFNYGFVPGTRADDGDASDALVLGPRLAIGARVRAEVQAVVRFRDDGRIDDKLVCAPAPLGRRDRALVIGFFVAYASAKRSWARLRGRRADTRFVGLDPAPA